MNGEGFLVLFILACIGFLAILGGLIYGIIWAINHVVIV
jgi:hypothetical protein